MESKRCALLAASQLPRPQPTLVTATVTTAVTTTVASVAHACATRRRDALVEVRRPRCVDSAVRLPPPQLIRGDVGGCAQDLVKVGGEGGPAWCGCWCGGCGIVGGCLVAGSRFAFALNSSKAAR